MRNLFSPSRAKSARAILSAAAITAMLPFAAHATLLYSDNFNTDTSANYNVYQTQTSAPGNTSTATFAWDYSALGIPSAPNSISDGSTKGLMVQSDNVASTAGSPAPWLIGAVSVATKGLSLPSQYVVSAEVWGNYLGGSSINDAGGTNGSTGITMGIGAKGAGVNYAVNNPSSGNSPPLTNEGGILVDAIRDATSSGGTYRVYVNGSNEGNGNFNNNYYAAGPMVVSGDISASQYNTTDGSNYYSSFMPSVTAPTVQSSAATTQGGSTQAGEIGFAWHAMTMTQTGTSVIWAIDGHTITTVPDTDFTAGGQQVTLGDQDGNTSGNNSIYNFDVFDDLTISTLPEPASISFLGIAGLSMLRRRRQA